jgi:hypothetical protein
MYRNDWNVFGGASDRNLVGLIEENNLQQQLQSEIDRKVAVRKKLPAEYEAHGVLTWDETHIDYNILRTAAALQVVGELEKFGAIIQGDITGTFRYEESI